MKYTMTLILLFSLLVFSCMEYPRDSLYDPEGEPNGDSDVFISRVEIIDGETISGHVEMGAPFSLKVFLGNSGTTPARNVTATFAGNNITYPRNQRSQLFEPIEPGQEATTFSELLEINPYSVACDGQLNDQAEIEMLVTWQDDMEGKLFEIEIPGINDANLALSHYDFAFGELDSGYVAHSFGVNVWLVNSGTTSARNILVKYQSNGFLEYYNVMCQDGKYASQEFNDILPGATGTTKLPALGCSTDPGSVSMSASSPRTMVVDVEAKWLGQSEFVTVGSMEFHVK